MDLGEACWIEKIETAPAAESVPEPKRAPAAAERLPSF
jgi:hypothetical protein